MLRTRFITAFTALPIVVAVIFLGGYWYVGVVAIFAVVAGWEFGHMMRLGGYQVTYVVILGLILALISDAFYNNLRQIDLIISAALLVSLVLQLLRRDSVTPTIDWALALAGGLYIGWAAAHLIVLRQLPDGQAWVLLALFANWGADTFAFFVGRSVGTRKLWPRHSPHKTWEGLAGGVVGGLIGAAVVLVFFPNLSWTTGLIVGAVIPIVGLFGDLSISMIKRHVGLKDTSNLFPGHGGFLDRIDSIMLVGIVVYYYAVWVG